MTQKLLFTAGAACLMALGAASSALAADGATNQVNTDGFRDTPMIPGTPWHLHDPDRPQPRVVTPGATFSQAAPAPSEEFCPYCTAPPQPSPVRKRSPSSSVDTGLVTRWGGGEENPTVEQLRAALAELDTEDIEHPSTWLVDDDDWCVDVYDCGLVIFADKDRDICQRRGVPRDEALELWLLLQQGRRDEIKQRLST